MNDERDQRPARNRDDPPIGPADQQQREQDHHVGIAACRDQPEPAVESTPYMDVHPETYDERALDQPLRRSEEHTSELQSLMRISYAVFCLKKKTLYNKTTDIIKSNEMTNKQQVIKHIAT